MIEQTFTRLWGMRLTFAVVVCVILFFHLLPLETTPRRWVGPDFLLGFACAWSLRRPEYVPSLALAGLFLLADRVGLIVTLVPPPAFGLWAFELMMTMLFYPVAVGITHGLLGVRKMAPGEYDAKGNTL